MEMVKERVESAVSNTQPIAFDEVRRPLTAAEWGLFEPVYPRVVGFKKVGVSVTKGHELIAAGELEIIKSGRNTAITTPSIVGYLNRRRLADNQRFQSTAA